MGALLLNHLIGVLDWLEYQLDALFFLRCELSTPEERKQKLQAYPQLLQVIEEIKEDWTLRNRFLNRNCDIASEALLWIEGRKPAHEQARKLWVEFLT